MTSIPHKKFVSFVTPLMCAAHRLEHLGNRCVFEPEGLTAATFKLLWILAEEGPLYLRALADHAAATMSNMSQRVSRLESCGFVERVRDPVDGDRRAVLVRATPAGLAAFRAAHARLQDGTFQFEQHFTAEERAQYHAFFHKFHGILDAMECELDPDNTISSS